MRRGDLLAHLAERGMRAESHGLSAGSLVLYSGVEKGLVPCGSSWIASSLAILEADDDHLLIPSPGHPGTEARELNLRI